MKRYAIYFRQSDAIEVRVVVSAFNMFHALEVALDLVGNAEVLKCELVDPWLL